MKKFEVAVSFNTGWVEVEVPDEFIEECEEMGIDRDEDTEILKRYIEDNPEEFMDYLALDDFNYEKTEDDDDYEDEDEEEDY